MAKDISAVMETLESCRVSGMGLMHGNESGAGAGGGSGRGNGKSSSSSGSSSRSSGSGRISSHSLSRRLGVARSNQIYQVRPLLTPPPS